MKGSRKIPEDPKEEGCYLDIELSWMDKNGDQVSEPASYNSRINIENISMLLFVYTDTNIQITGEAAGGCRVGSCSQGDEGSWAHCSCRCLIEILFNI